MHQKEDLVARAGPALADSNARRVLLSLLAMYGEAGVVGAVVKVNQALKIEHALAASLRYGATLARDFPEAFQQLLSDFDKKESEKIIMSEPQVVTAEVLTAEHLYSGKRFPFMLVDWRCELVVSHIERSDEEVICNFCITFPRRTLRELDERLCSMASVGDRFIVDGIPITASIKFVGSDRNPKRGGTDINTRWIAWQNGSTEVSLPVDEEISYVDCRFQISNRILPNGKLYHFRIERFCDRLMLAHLHHYFGIPVEPCGYAPAPKEESVPQASDERVGRYGTSLSLTSLAWDQLLSTAVMSRAGEINFKRDCDGMRVWIREKKHECRWHVPEGCHLGDVYDLVKRKAGLDLDSEEGTKKRRQGKFNECFFLRHIDCTVETYYDDCGHGESLVIILSSK